MMVPEYTWLVGLMALWRQVQAFLERLVSTVIVTARFDGSVGMAVSAFCWNKLHHGPSGNRRFIGTHVFVRPTDRHEMVALECPPVQSMLFMAGRAPVFVRCQSGEKRGGDPQVMDGISICYFRGSLDLDAFIVKAVSFLNERKQKTGSDVKQRFAIYRKRGRSRKHQQFGNMENSQPRGSSPVTATGMREGEEFEFYRIVGWTRDQLGQTVSKSAMRSVAFPKEVIELIEEARVWRDSEKWFKEHGVPWRRGWQLNGRPGTGKTTLVRGVGWELDLPVYLFDLGTMDNSELVEEWDNMLSCAPAIALFEDIDNIFHGRENILGEESGLTFDCLLNCISGVQTADGILVVITTNDVSKIDHALGVADKNGMSTRPGRIDRVVELKNIDAECRTKVAEAILGDWPEEVGSIVLAGDGDTPAQFSERCTKLALALFNRDKFGRANEEDCALTTLRA